MSSSPPWLPAPASQEPWLAPQAAAGRPAGRWCISFFEAVMLGVVGGAVGGGILGGLNASGAVDTVLTVEFGAVFGVLVGVLIAVVLALASRLLAAHRHPQSATSQPSEPGRADTSGLAALGNTVTAHVSVGEVEVRSRLVNLLEVLEHEHAAIEAIGHPSLDETLAAITRLQGEIVAPLESLPPPGGNGRHA